MTILICHSFLETTNLSRFNLKPDYVGGKLLTAWENES